MLNWKCFYVAMTIDFDYKLSNSQSFKINNNQKHKQKQQNIRCKTEYQMLSIAKKKTFQKIYEHIILRI